MRFILTVLGLFVGLVLVVWILKFAFIIVWYGLGLLLLLIGLRLILQFFSKEGE